MNMLSPIHTFFSCSELVDYEVLRPLSHIKPNWELTWDFDNNTYKSEVESFASLFNEMIDELATCTAPLNYHGNEDALAEYVQQNLNWDIRPQGKIWVSQNGKRLTPDDYLVTLEQGAFDDAEERQLISAAAGRIRASLALGQMHFDDVEESHRRILAGVLCSILYHRAS